MKHNFAGTFIFVLLLRPLKSKYVGGLRVWCFFDLTNKYCYVILFLAIHIYFNLPRNLATYVIVDYVHTHDGIK